MRYFQQDMGKDVRREKKKKKKTNELKGAKGEGALTGKDKERGDKEK